MMFCGTAVSSADIVPLTSAVGTYDQGGGFEVAGLIDGRIGGNNGWAVFGGQFDPQSAIVTTASPLSTPTLAFELAQLSPYLNHNVNQFRISATNDPAPSAGSTWTPVNISNALSGVSGNGGSTLFKVDDNKILARDNGAEVEHYLLSGASPFNGITGFRLEVFPVDFDPNDGMAATIGHATNGNFVLSEFIPRNSTDGLNRNVALGHPVIQSTNGYGFDGVRGVDGNIGGNGNDISHSNDGDLLPFWEVDLESDVLIDDVDIFNRFGCCPERLYNITVEVRNSADAVVYTSPVLNPKNPGDVLDDPGMYLNVEMPGAGVTGRKVRIVKNANNGAEWLSISEVQVNVATTLPAINILGDFSGDGLITVADFDILRNNFHEGTTYEQGDINFDGQIDLNDFTAFVNAYNAANSASVPEPSTWALLGVGAIFLGLVRRRRNSG